MSNKYLVSENLEIDNLEYPLYHIGTLDISNKSKHSYEGNGLSVSICPSAWQRIARCSSSKVWKLEKENIKLLDYHNMPKEEFFNIRKWGVENGYLEKVFGRYAYSYFSDELDRDMCVLCDNLKKALEEAGIETSYDSYEEYLDSDEGDEDVIYPVESFKATNKLIKESLIDVEEGHSAVEQNFLLYIEKYTDYDGVYWDDYLDILGLSAPRGVIFNDRLKSFNIELITKGSENGCYDVDDISDQLFEDAEFY